MSELTEIMKRRNPAGPVHGWSGTQSYVVNTTSPNPVNNGEFNVQAQFPTTTYYTVQFTLRPGNQSGIGPGIFAPRGLAEIHWTVQGNHHQRILHVANGTTISGAGEAIWVNFVDDTQVNGEEPNNQLPITAIISIVTGTRANAADSQPPMFWEESGTVGGVPTLLPTVIPAAGTIQIDVPVDQGVNAMLLTAFRENAGAGAPLLGDDITVQGVFGLIFWGAEMFNRWVPVVPGETKFNIQNNSGNNVRFGVIWGVEG
jgi:hypothetical protein